MFVDISHRHDTMYLKLYLPSMVLVRDSMVTLSVLDPLPHNTGLTPENQKTIKLLNFDSTQIDLSKLVAT